MTLAPSELRIFTLKVAILIGFLVLGYMIFELRNILGILAFSAFVTILLSPILTSLKKRKIPEWISISLIAMGVVVFFITLFFLVAPVLARESVRLVNLAIEKINYQPGQPLQMILPEPIRTALSPFIDNLDIEQLINFLKTHLQDISTTIGSGGMRAVGAFAWTVFSTILTVIATIFMLLERKALKKIMYQSLPRTWSIFLAEREEKILAALGAWIWGQCILSVIMASLVFVGLHAINFFFGIHMERIFPLAILTGMMEFIPYIGPLIAILPALALASSIGINATLIILVFYIIIQQLENHFIVPYVMSRTLQISPLLVFVTVLIGAELAGVIGIILAVPVAGMIRIFTEHLYQAKARK